MSHSSKEQFTDLISRNNARIKRICRAYTQNEDDWKDLQQEVYYHLWKSLPTFKAEANIDTWLYRVTLNVCLHFSSQQKKKATLPLQVEHLKQESIASHNKEQEELLQQLYTCIHKLEATDKTLVLLYLEEFPYKEIASVTGLKENTVAVKLGRIREKLFGCITVA
jgi:RNA polymerase sigma factor (sigma-70 family)